MVFKMKKIILGKLYDTETAKLIGTYSSSNLQIDEENVIEELYQKENGEFFIYGKDKNSSVYCAPSIHDYCPNGHYIYVLDEELAQDWIASYLDADVFIKLFGKPEE